MSERNGKFKWFSILGYQNGHVRHEHRIVSEQFRVPNQDDLKGTLLYQAYLVFLADFAKSWN